MDSDGGRRGVITGAAGGIGALVLRRLGARWQIRGTDLRSGPGLEELDVTDLRACRAVFQGVDAVVHLAANPAPEASWEELRSPNVEGTYAVAAAAREAGVSRLVLASS